MKIKNNTQRQKAKEPYKKQGDKQNQIVPRCVVHHADCLEKIKSLENESVDLIVTSPPYNIGKEYEKKKNLDVYLFCFEPLIKEMHRVLKNSGSVCWQVGNYVNKGEIVPLDIKFYPMFEKHGFQLRNRIIWHFGHGLHCKYRFSGRHETILWFSKSDDYTFNLDDVRVPSKYPNKKSYKGKNKGQLSGNPLGKNPSDVWLNMKNDWESGLFNVPNVKSNHCEKTIHPCQFPIKIAERCILALSNEGDIVLDCYAGVGSTMIACLKHKRNAIGVELKKEYVDVCEERIEKFNQGNLKIRKLCVPPL